MKGVSSSLCGKTHFLNELVILLGYFYTVTVKPCLLQQVLNSKYYMFLCFCVFLSQTSEFCEMICKYLKSIITSQNSGHDMLVW